MPRISSKNKLLIAVKYIAVLVAILFIGIIIFLIVKKNDPKIPQKEVTVHLKIDDKLNICLPVDDKQ